MISAYKRDPILYPDQKRLNRLELALQFELHTLAGTEIILHFVHEGWLPYLLLAQGEGRGSFTPG